MIPRKPIPYSEAFASPEEYLDSLLRFATTTDLFQILCGGVHVLDFFTSEKSLFETTLPQDWQAFIHACDIYVFLDFLMRDDLEDLDTSKFGVKPPDSLVQYARDIRRYSLDRSFTPRKQKLPVLPRNVAVGMKVKKVHEVTNFADYVDRLVEGIGAECGEEITHLVDFGSGQNYLGRALASPPYNRYVVAVEGREHNIAGAKQLDMLAGIAQKPTVRRNKKLFIKALEDKSSHDQSPPKVHPPTAKEPNQPTDQVADLRSQRQIALEATYIRGNGRGYIQYISGQLDNGDLSHILTQIDRLELEDKPKPDDKLMAISIHSCGNLSHFGIRSLILNPSIRAVAIVGCCYNLLTEKLGPPSYKPPFVRPSLQPINGRVIRESSRFDPEGFPMSQRFTGYNGMGIRLNITARMMACQAPENWTREESEGFYTRHFYRAVLQRIFLDRGVVRKVRHWDDDAKNGEEDKEGETPFNMSTNPVIIGSLRKGCYGSFKTYVRGAITKLSTQGDYKQYADVIREKMVDITDEEIERYEGIYVPRKKEIAAVWSLMAFSACVVEAMIVSDRLTFLEEHKRAGVVRECWVESVFDYRQSPRNLVVVGIKK